MNNLLTDPWLPIRRSSGKRHRIRLCDLSESISSDPVVDLDLPRPDFHNALLQFGIGLLQTCCMLDDEDDWFDWWQKPPAPSELEARFRPFLPAFNLAGNEPRFLQEIALAQRSDAGSNHIASLLIDEPGGNTTKLNKDLFIKRARIPGMAEAEAVMALITLQCMAPSGGVGHRTSLRGGGPLTTLLMPDPNRGEPDTLWHRLWLNVLDGDQWQQVPGLQTPITCDERIFPWLGTIRSSEKAGSNTTIENAHSLQHYWSMPRRILLDRDSRIDGPCPMGGDGPLLTTYLSKNYGINYTGPWQHPLSPYYRDKKSEWLPLHPQPGGFTYQHWHAWAQPRFEDEASQRCARVVSERHASTIAKKLACAGYDMDNMKARCFYLTEWPLFHFPQLTAGPAAVIVRDLAEIADRCAQTTRGQVRKAWLRRPGDKSDSTNNASAAVHLQVFERSQDRFFSLLDQLAAYTADPSQPAPLGTSWHEFLCRIGQHVFDDYTAIESIADDKAGRIASARAELAKFLRSKSLRDLTKNIDETLERLQGATA